LDDCGSTGTKLREIQEKPTHSCTVVVPDFTQARMLQHFPLERPDLMRHFLPSTESTSIDKSRKPVYKVGRRVCVKRSALRRRVRKSPGSSGKISNRQKQREGKLRGERVTGEDV